MKLAGTISVDVDTLHSIFKGRNLALGQEYDWSEFEEGLVNICKLFDEFDIRSTLFCTGYDFTITKNQKIIKDVYLRGHEIANHGMNHVQGLRFLSRKEKENEIVEFEQICQEIIGERPVGFRAPGWNIDEQVLELLIERGYKYDSSIFPTYLMPVMKIMHYFKMATCSYMFCPVRPYKTQSISFWPGSGGIWEFPITVAGYLRFPFFATVLFKLGFDSFKKFYYKIKDNKNPVQFMLHLFDFVDFSKRCYSQQIINLKGVYVPQSISMPYKKKLDLLKRAIDVMIGDYNFKTYRERCIE